MVDRSNAFVRLPTLQRLEGTNLIFCCVFRPANACSVGRSLVEINFFLFCSVSDGKSCFSVRKSISTSERRAEHPFANQNTQQYTLK